MVLSGLSDRLNKPLTCFARGLGKIGLTPNHLTLLGLTFSTIAGYGYYRYTPQTRWIPLTFLALAGMFDALDGVMARELSKKSKLGGVLDSTADRIGESAMLLGMVLGGTVNVTWGFLALIFSFMVSYVRARAEGEGVSLKGRGLVERPERMLILIAATLADRIEVGVAALAILSLITMCQRLWHLYRVMKEDAVKPNLRV